MVKLAWVGLKRDTVERDTLGTHVYSLPSKTYRQYNTRILGNVNNL
jgi:hypothetical protein